jgi:hypothetical protein
MEAAALTLVRFTRLGWRRKLTPKVSIRVQRVQGELNSLRYAKVKSSCHYQKRAE